MSNQLAKLYLRGSLMNVTAQGLSEEEKKQCQDLVYIIEKCPLLTNPIAEFCMALGRTIGNEYRDFEVGLQDARIALWKATVMTLFHESKRCTECNKHHVTSHEPKEKCECGGKLKIKWSPKKDIISEVQFNCRCGENWIEHDVETATCKCGKEINGKHIKRKKFFQTILFNYLRQILRENKPPSKKREIEISSPADETFVQMLENILNNCKESRLKSFRSTKQETIILHSDTGMIPQTTLLKTHALIDEFESLGVNVEVTANAFHITPLFKLEGGHVSNLICRTVVKREFVKCVSLDSAEDSENSSYRDYLEYQVNTPGSKSKKIVDELDGINTVRHKLNADAKPVLDLIINTPMEYYETFKTNKIYKSHVAKFLGKSKTEIDHIWRSIKSTCESLDIIPG